MDNKRPAGFGILNRNPHAAEPPAYSQIWENVCPGRGGRRPAHRDQRHNPRRVLSAKLGEPSQHPLKGKRTTPRKGGGGQAITPEDCVPFLELPR